MQDVECKFSTLTLFCEVDVDYLRWFDRVVDADVADVDDVDDVVVVVGWLSQRARGVRQHVPDERGGAQQRQLQPHPAGHLQEHVQDRHHVVSLRRPKVHHEVRLVDLRRHHGQFRRTTSDAVSLLPLCCFFCFFMGVSSLMFVEKRRTRRMAWYWKESHER